jgi:phosphomannomutase
MNAEKSLPEPCDYRCPGQRHPISRAVHLGRLAAFYPACRQCPHRDDTGTLSPRQVEQLAETNRHAEPRLLFHDEGAGGVYLNDLTPPVARDIATAFGTVLQQEREERGEGREKVGRSSIRHSSFSILHSANPQSLIPNPSVLLAGDGRTITAELVAAVGEGLRWSGCDVVDLGPATAACLAFAINHLQAAGGLLVGNPGQEPHTAGLQFWTAGPRPLSVGGSLEPIVERYQAGASRPKRNCGDLHRFQAEEPYLATFAEHYHALRPLRVAVDSASTPMLEYLKQLAATVACQIIPCRTTRHDLPEQVRGDAAHFAACVDGDGETCRVCDEQGRPVPTERLLLLLAPNAGAIVLENTTPRVVADRLEQRGVQVAMSGPHRAEMVAAMQEQGAQFGGGPSSRFWHAGAGVPLPDALVTITRLLVLLSRSDEPFSAVLDRLPAVG